MSESAIMGRRERKTLETAAKLTAVSRRFTAERGLTGFTIEEVCEVADVSRRTFFNYFSSKEDAVLGVDPDEESHRFAADFLAQGPSGWPAVLDDLVGLVSAHVDAVGVDAAEHTAFMAALEREPRLLARFIGVTRERERHVVELVAQREGVGADDPRAVATVSILSTLMRSTGARFTDPDNTDDFSLILTELLAAFRAVLSTPAPRKDTP